MRISLLLFFLGIFFNTWATPIKTKEAFKISMKNAVVRDVLKEMESKTGYRFFFSDDFVDIYRKVNIDIESDDVTEFLAYMFRESTVTYKLLENNVVVITPVKTAQQAIVITGTVSDSDGQPLPGVSVSVRNTTLGTATDGNGAFTLSVPDGNAVLAFSYIGYITQEITVGNRRTINISLLEDTRMMEEVVVIGYGTVKKANLTGAVGYIDNTQLENRAVSTLTQALQGKVSGVNISSSSGMPGAVQNINIRGYTGLGRMAEPLLVIDGVQGGNISDIEINDVESISFLKDAASSAIYGSSAPYGVILVTTKKGRAGKPVITYNNNFGWSSPINLPHMSNSLDFANAYNQAAINGKQATVIKEGAIDRITRYMAGTLKEETERDPGASDEWRLFFDANGNNDWFDIYFKDSSFSQRHNIGVSGATESSNYYIGLGYTQQDGMFNFANETDQRYNTRVNLSSNLTKWLTVSARTSYMRSHQNLPAAYSGFGNGGSLGSITSANPDIYSYSYDVLHMVGNTFPVVPFKEPTGRYSQYSYTLGFTEGGRQNRNTDNISLTGEFVVKLLPGWDVTGNYTYVVRNFEHTNHAKTFYTERPSGELAPRAGSSPNQFFRRFDKTQDQVINAFTSYQKTLGDHNFNAVLGFNQRLNTYVRMTGSNNMLISDEVPMLSLTYGTATALADAEWEEASRGAFGRIQYNFKEKYLLELNGKYDGTSKYLKDYRMKFYPGISAAWAISKESFWNPLVDYVNMFKLRVSYASLGNQTYSGRYDFYPGLSRQLSTNTQWFFAGDTREMSFSSPGLVDYSLTWVTTQTLDFGFDLGAFKNRLDFSFDWYRRFEKDFIGPAQTYPALLGTSAAGANNTDIETKGWEITIGWRDNINEFSYGANFTLSDYQGKILKYPNPTKRFTTWYDGKQMGEIWGFETVGLIRTEAEAEQCRQTQRLLDANWFIGDVHYKNNGDVLTYGARTLDDPGDQKVIGNNTPRYSYGLNLNAEWKGFDATLFFQGIGKRDIMFHYSSNYFWGITGWGTFQSNVFTIHDRFHQQYVTDPDYDFLPDNLNGYLPNAYLNNYKNYQSQSGYLQSGAYMRLKNFQLGYTIPKIYTDKIKCQKARFFVNGENLFTFTKLLKIVDPEIVDTNVSWNDTESAVFSTGKVYPVRRTWSFGLNVTF